MRSASARRVARAGIDHRQLAVALDPDHRVEGVVLQIADDDFIHPRFETEKKRYATDRASSGAEFALSRFRERWAFAS